MLRGEELALGVDHRDAPSDRAPLGVAGLRTGETDHVLAEREGRLQVDREIITLGRRVLLADDFEHQAAVSRRRDVEFHEEIITGAGVLFRPEHHVGAMMLLGVEGLRGAGHVGLAAAAFIDVGDARHLVRGDHGGIATREEQRSERGPRRGLAHRSAHFLAFFLLAAARATLTRAFLRSR